MTYIQLKENIMELKFVDNLEFEESGMDAVVTGTSSLLMVKTDSEIIHIPEQKCDDLKRIDDSIIENIEKSGIKCYRVTRGGGSIVMGPGDLVFILTSFLSLDIKCEEIIEFLISYFKEAGFSDSVVSGNDIMVNGRKVVGIASDDYPRFGMRVTSAVVTLTDHTETFEALYGQFFNKPWYKIPGYIPLDKDKLLENLKKYLEMRGC